MIALKLESFQGKKNKVLIEHWTEEALYWFDFEEGLTWIIFFYILLFYEGLEVEKLDKVCKNFFAIDLKKENEEKLRIGGNLKELRVGL
jgi:hypothetical protein